MKYCGDNEERAEPHAVHPRRYLFPSIIREPVEKGTAHDGGNNEELRKQNAIVKSLSNRRAGKHSVHHVRAEVLIETI